MRLLYGICSFYETVQRQLWSNWADDRMAAFATNRNAEAMNDD
jgi:hypothetical protein